MYIRYYPSFCFYKFLKAAFVENPEVQVEYISPGIGLQSASENCPIYAISLLKHMAKNIDNGLVNKEVDVKSLKLEDPSNPSPRNFIYYKNLESVKGLELLKETYGDIEIKPGLRISSMIEEVLPDIREIETKDGETIGFELKLYNYKNIYQSGFNTAKKVKDFVDNSTPEQVYQAMKEVFASTKLDSTNNNAILAHVDDYVEYLDNYDYVLYIL